MRQKFSIRSKDKTLELGQRTCIMGILNITPDSFSDGGKYFSTQQAIQQGLQLLSEGADILDVGAQSTRPGSQQIGAEEELRRILPVLTEIRKSTSAWISIDTYHSEVARACLEAGADMINDVSSFRQDQAMAACIAEAQVPVVCMHFLQSLHPMPENPQYEDLFTDILEFFAETFHIAKSADVKNEQIVVDPGIGFGKNLEHNKQIIHHLNFLETLGRPILVGPSRKSFIGKITGLPVDQRLEGTAAAVGLCILRGGHIIRVHDVSFFRRYCDVLDSLMDV